MKNQDKQKLKFEFIDNSNVYQNITSEKSNWSLLNFEARIIREGNIWYHNTGENEYAIVILGGVCSIESTFGNWFLIGERKTVFDGMPYAVYLPRKTEFAIYAETELDIAYAWCKSNNDHFAKLINPDDVKIEIMGVGNATCQINSIIPPGFDCDKLMAIEVFTPSGNWSSYPPHKHDKHTIIDGELVEADLEEIYFYKFNKYGGFALQHLYTGDKKLNEAIIVQNNDVVIIPEGYHPMSAVQGYDAYYLNFLAGSAHSNASTYDSQHQWIKVTEGIKDPRLPLVKLRNPDVN